MSSSSSSEQMRLSVNGQSQVPPGFRFHPTEEELLHYYLRKKVAYQKIDLDVIRDVDLNKLEPWDIQDKCKIGSGPQNDWYFFSHKDKKYPTGTRTNRATAAGFWKATGRDKVIHSNLRRIGMRKTLVFYKGRAPHGQKSDWIMHEYRLDDTSHPTTTNGNNINDPSLVSDSMSEEGWVVCRVFKKKNYGQQKGGMDSSSAVIMETAAIQVPNSSAVVDDHGVLDQILMYMGRSSTCKQEQLEAVANSLNGSSASKYASPGCMHLPKLDNPAPTATLLVDRRPPLPPTNNYHRPMEDLYFQVESEEVPGCCYQGDKMNDWMAFDRLVASQLNGQVETPHSAPMSCGVSLCVSSEHVQSTAEGVAGFSVSRLSSHQTSGAYDNSENDFWSFNNRSSSSSSSDPLSHLSV